MNKNNELRLKHSLGTRICVYILIMLMGIALRTYITHSITIVWIVNLMGLLVFASYLRFANSGVLQFCIAYLFAGLITLFINFRYIGGSLKSIGTNVNIIILPIMLVISTSQLTKRELNEETISKALKFISTVGFFSAAFALITSYRAIINVFTFGRSIYTVNVSGFFYGKNIYGAFIALTAVADLYFLVQKKSTYRVLILVAKIIATIVSFSRAALLMLGVILFLFFWTDKSRTLKDYLKLFLVGVAVVAFILLVLSNDRLYRFFYNSVFRVSIGDAGREVIRNQAIESMKKSLLSVLFGVGYAGIDAIGIDVDDTYLYLWFSGGIPKLAFYAIILLLSFYHIYQLKSKNKLLYRICLSAFWAYLAYTFFESTAVLELGLLNFIFTFYIIMLPFSYSRNIAG